MVEKVYKIVLLDHLLLKTLFRAIDGSRYLIYNRWLNANKQMGKDGANQEPYLTGIHCFKNRDVAIAYLSRFRTEKNRIVIECQAEGLRRKPTNKNVYLADRIRILSILNEVKAALV